MPDDRITIRGIDPEIYQKLRVFAVQRGITVGEAFNILAKEFFEYKANESKVKWRLPRS